MTDPTWRELIDTEIKLARATEWMGLYVRVIGTYALVAHPSEQLYQPDPSVEPLGSVTHAPLDMCDGSMKNHKLEFKALDWYTIKASCDRFEIELSTDSGKLGPLKMGPFVNLGINTKGDVSVFAGSKGSFDSSINPSISAKSGIYVKFGSGGFKDAGIKVDFTGSAATISGTGKISTKLDSMEFSFMPSPPSPGPASGLSVLQGGAH